MKKLFLAVFTFGILATPCFAIQNIELAKGSEYLYFSTNRIQSIKSNNPDIISAQRISTINGDEQQIIFTAKKSGKADIQIQTEKGLISYAVEIKGTTSTSSTNFIELDVPGIVE